MLFQTFSRHIILHSLLHTFSFIAVVVIGSMPRMVSNTLLDASLSYAPTLFSYAYFFTVYLEKTLINEIWPTRAHATLYAADNNGVILAQFSRHY